MRVFRLEVARESTRDVTGPPIGCWRKSSSSSSRTAFSAMGFLLRFFFDTTNLDTYAVAFKQLIMH